MKKMTLLLLFLLLAACGNDYPAITHFEFKGETGQQTISTTDPSELSTFAALFFDRTEVEDDVAPEFKYIIGIEVDGEKERWRCSEDGYCRLYAMGDTPIYRLERYVELFQRVKK